MDSFFFKTSMRNNNSQIEKKTQFSTPLIFMERKMNDEKTQKLYTDLVGR